MQLSVHTPVITFAQYWSHRFTQTSHHITKIAVHYENIHVLSGHSLEGTHLLESSSMIVPLGHVHTPLQTCGQDIKLNLLAQVVAHSGSSPHF